MQISWHGQYTVKVVSKEVTLVLDPFPSFRSKADIIALTNPTEESMNQVSGIQGEPIVVDTPGEYSIKGLTLNCLGWMPEEGLERNVQRWVIEDMVVLHLGALNRAFETKELQELERTDVDVLIVPIGGGSGLTTKQALQMVATLEPRVVIPIHYKLPGEKEELEDIRTFATEMGVDPKNTEKKIILKRGKLPQEDVLTAILVP
ncbi:MAG: MBL fold metallo-hydrolase [Candidatus Andersenbacteria bacterium]